MDRLTHLVFPLLLLLGAGRTRGTISSTTTVKAKLGGTVVFHYNVTAQADVIDWTFSHSAGGQRTNVCNWFRNNQVECSPAYSARVELRLNESLILRSLRYTDAGWYHLHITYGLRDDHRRSIRLRIHASAPRMAGSHLFLILGLSLLKGLLW